MTPAYADDEHYSDNSNRDTLFQVGPRYEPRYESPLNPDTLKLLALLGSHPDIVFDAGKTPLDIGREAIPHMKDAVALLEQLRKSHFEKRAGRIVIVKHRRSFVPLYP